MNTTTIETTLCQLLPESSVKEMVAQYNGDPFQALFNADESEWKRVRGMGDTALRKLRAIKDLVKGVHEKSQLDLKSTSTPEEIFIAMSDMQFFEKEHFRALFLNVKNKMIKAEDISVGGLTSSTAEQRAIFKQAIKLNAAAIILVHNHPSGDPTPSSDDIRVTRIMARAGEVMGIPVLDHVIIGRGVYTSLLERGEL